MGGSTIEPHFDVTSVTDCCIPATLKKNTKHSFLTHSPHFNAAGVVVYLINICQIQWQECLLTSPATNHQGQSSCAAHDQNKSAC
mmetsp:Transcript_3210/g.6287  ORF Transcript_3210/g.6287 Transcript_3210/m.6287 type:complete len:85 (+) Transcript_3210:103-357(+)